MARTTKQLTDAKVRSKLAPGMYRDGNGLYLQVTAANAKSWIFRYSSKHRLSANGKPISREMGLGSLLQVSLAQARERVDDLHKLRGQGIDPMQHRDEQARAQAQKSARAVTFEQAAERYLETHRAGWRNAKHAGQWESSLETYAMPKIGSMAVSDIDTAAVLKVLDPIWTDKTETATRLRGRIELILDWAKTRGYRDGENPARWRGHLDKALARPSRVHRVAHHAALPFDSIPAFMQSVRLLEGVAGKALEFTILTAARTGEVIGATFAEMDLDAKVWTIPAGRMKAGKEHRVPLGDRAVAIVKGLQEMALGEFVFPGMRKGTALSNMAMLKQLQRLDYSDITVHGFRSTFRDWAAERTNFPRDVVEMALAHAIASEVEAAYRRGDLFEKRRRLMDAWANYCASKPVAKGGAVVAMRAG